MALIFSLLKIIRFVAKALKVVITTVVLVHGARRYVM